MVKASGRVITVTMLPTFNAMTWSGSSAAGTPWRWSALGCDRDQAIEFAAVTVRVVPARYRQQAAGLQRPIKIVPCLYGIEPVFGEGQSAGGRCGPGVDQRDLDEVVSVGRMIDVAAGFGIDQRHAGLTIEMAGEIGELVGEHFEDRGVDLDSA